MESETLTVHWPQWGFTRSLVCYSGLLRLLVRRPQVLHCHTLVPFIWKATTHKKIPPNVRNSIAMRPSIVLDKDTGKLVCFRTQGKSTPTLRFILYSEKRRQGILLSAV